MAVHTLPNDRPRTVTQAEAFDSIYQVTALAEMLANIPEDSTLEPHQLSDYGKAIVRLTEDAKAFICESDNWIEIPKGGE